MMNKEVDELQEGVDFELTEIGSDRFGISFNGLTFLVNSVSVEEDAAGRGRLLFDYDLYDGQLDEDDVDEYEHCLGMVIEKLMREQYEESQ